MNVICCTVEDNEGFETEIKLPARWAICDRCDGNGKHDNPAFSNGLTQEDFDEDPDFRRHYFAGRYDVQCGECSGTGKVLVPDPDSMTPAQKEQLKAYEQQERAHAASLREEALIRRMESGGAY